VGRFVTSTRRHDNSPGGRLGDRPRPALRRSTLLRPLIASVPVQRAVQTLRARHAVVPSTRFVVRQLAGARTGVGRYTLRSTGAAVHLRHATRDVDILNEIFGGVRGSFLYEPPPEITHALAARDELRVVDLGGNIGLFGVFATSRWRVRKLDSYEPDPANAALLRATIEANHLSDRWTAHEVAVSNRAGRMPFRKGLFSESSIAAPGEASADVEMADLFGLGHDDVDLLKIDIEGGEWALLGDERFASYPARALVMEWHAWMCPRTTPHEAAHDLLRAARWRVVLDDPSNTGPVGTIWAVRD
jgi:FkbM family methyltransferase